MLLRNHSEFVPPQHFLERLTHILLRRRERVARSVFQRDDDDDDDDDGGGGRTTSRKHDTQKEANASLAAREDDRLLRATAEIFRRVNARHPAALAARFDSEPTGSTRKAHVRVGARTWTPLDSDRRAGSICDQSRFSESFLIRRFPPRDAVRTLDARDARASRGRARATARGLESSRRWSARRAATWSGWTRSLIRDLARGEWRGGEALARPSRRARMEGRARANRRNAYAGRAVDA